MANAHPADDELRDLNQEVPLADRDQPRPSDAGDDPFAAGTPGGGTEVGGLAGTNIGDGAPGNADLEDVMGGSDFDADIQEDAESGGPYGGLSGGAVGGTPAEKRASGGNVHGGIAPGGTHRGDSTVGADPSGE